MKKFFTLIAAVAMAASVNAQTETALIDVDGSYSGGQLLTSENAQLTLAVEGEEFSVKAGTLASDAPYVACLQGKNNPKDADGANYSESKQNLPATGCYYVFTAKKGGKAEVGIQLGNGKSFFLVDGETGKNDVEKTLISKDGDEVKLDDNNQVDTKFYGTVNFEAVAGKSYYVFCNASKLSVYGYQFTPTVETGISSALVDAASANSGKTYNLAGQQVSSSYKGLVIKNGKKYVK